MGLSPLKCLRGGNIKGNFWSELFRVAVVVSWSIVHIDQLKMVLPCKTFQLTFTTYAISLLIGTVTPDERTVSKDHSSKIQGDPLPFYKIGYDYEGLPGCSALH